MRGSTQNLGPIGSAVLTFIGYKRTDKKSINDKNNLRFVSDLIFFSKYKKDIIYL